MFKAKNRGNIVTLDLNVPLSKDSLEFLQQASLRSYGTAKELQDFYTKAGFKSEFIEDVKTDGQAFIVYSSKFTFIAFRGTEKKWLDIWTDLKLLPVSTPLGNIHCGFFATFQRLWPTLKSKIDPNLPLVITGHSLGGALAQLCALWSCHDLKLIPEFVVTFAQPRVGSFKLALSTSKLLKNRHFRIVKNLDIVPRVPPWWILYCHSNATAYKRTSMGNGVPHNFIDRHCWNFGLPAFLAIIYGLYHLILAVIQSHSIAGY